MTLISAEPLEIVDTADLLDCGHRAHMWCVYPFIKVPPIRSCDVPMNGTAKDCEVCRNDPPVCAVCVENEPVFFAIHDVETGSCIEIHRAQR